LSAFFQVGAFFEEQLQPHCFSPLSFSPLGMGNDEEAGGQHETPLTSADIAQLL
jgi:hypothetical protein